MSSDLTDCLACGRPSDDCECDDCTTCGEPPGGCLCDLAGGDDEEYDDAIYEDVLARASGAPVEGMVTLPARPVPWLRDAVDTEPLAAGLLIGSERYAEAVAAGWRLRPWYGSAREQFSGPKWWQLCEREPTGGDDE